jgi:hypothetical protein
MPALGPRLVIPTSLRAVDQGVYPQPEGGAAGDAFVGVHLAETDRTLHAYLRRAQAAGLPVDAPARIGSLDGLEVPAWDVWGTPKLEAVAWRLRWLAPAGHKLLARAYATGARSAQPWARPSLDDGDTAELVGTGAEETTAAILCRLAEGPQQVGLILQSLQATGTVLTGAVAAANEWEIISTASSFGGLPSPTCKAICITDGVGGAQLTPWRQVARAATWALANDTAVLTRPLDPAWRASLTTTPAWRLVPTSYADIYALSLRETPLAGSLAERS